jgi:hypothetical protein
MRHTAWLTATPTAQPSKGKPQKSVQQKSRLERLKADGKQPQYPPQPACYYLVDYLWAFGPYQSVGMGFAPVPFTEINAWQHSQGIALSPWECGTLHRMSVAFVAENAAASQDADRKPPFHNTRDLQRIKAAALQTKLDDFLN